jgi:predicted nucleic acid-binding protein
VRVLVDTSVWIDYFRTGQNSADLDQLIQEDLVATNDIILAELIPYLKLNGQTQVIALLEQLFRQPLQIDWPGIIELQHQCLKNGANGIGIPDLLIAQHAQQERLPVYSLDRHFRLLEQIISLALY